MSVTKKVLIVDDTKVNRIFFSYLVDQQIYEVVEAENGYEALTIIEDCLEDIVLIILDLMMPEMDGFKVLDIIEQYKWYRRIPIIVITGDDSPETEDRCFDKHVYDLVYKPFKKGIIKNRITNALELYESRNDLEHKLYKTNKYSEGKINFLQNKITNMIRIFGGLCSYSYSNDKDKINRICTIIDIISKHISINNIDECKVTPFMGKKIVEYAPLYDLGLLFIDKDLDESSEEYKLHTVKGAEVVNEMIQLDNAEKYNEIIYNICKYHHEKYDGTGYPEGLKGDNIPIEAQIVGLACYVDSYKDNPCIDFILEDIGVEAYNPILVNALKENFDQVLKLYK